MMGTFNSLHLIWLMNQNELGNRLAWNITVPYLDVMLLSNLCYGGGYHVISI